MTDLALPLALFAAGLASGLHCAGMCGGISASFSLLQKEKIWKRQLAFNAGRITSYAAAGAAAGTLGSAAAYAAAYLDEDSPMRADAVTVSPYLGFGSLDPFFDVEAETRVRVPGQTYRVVVRDLANRGDLRMVYRMTVEPVRPDFSLTLAADSFVLEKGKPLASPAN